MAVRQESVRVSVEDAGFTTGMAKMAAQTAALEKALNSLDGTNVSVDSSTKSVGDSTEKATKKTKQYDIAAALAEQTTARFKKQLRDQANAMLDATQKTDLAAKAVKGVGDNSDSSGRQIDRLSGRLSLLAQAAAVLGPALVPLGAATVPAIAGLAAQMGALAGAVGVGALAFNGLGDGLKALNEYQLKPTAENFKALQLEMKNIGPAGADFVNFLDQVGPEFSRLQMVAREGLFPGLEDGISNILPLLPRVRDIISEIATAMGDLASDAGANLAGPEWESFFSYLKTDAAPTLTELGKSLGNFAQGLANLMVGLSPAASDFSGGLLEMSRSFAEWSRTLESNESFQSFVDYIREAGPKAVDFLGSLVSALAQIATAAAPIGDTVLPVLTTMLDLIGKLAASPLGSVLIGLAAGASAISRAMALAEAATMKFASSVDTLSGSSARGSSAMTGLARAGAALAVLSVAGVAIDGIRDAAIGAAPEVERLTASLIDANSRAFNAEFGGSVKQALDSLDPGTIDTIANSLNGLGDKAGIAGPAVDGFVNVLGGLVGFSQPLNETAVQSGKVAEAFGALDSALAAMVASAGPERAKQALEDLAVSQGLSADETKVLTSQLPQYNSALLAAANAADLSSEAEGKHAGAMKSAAEAARAEAQALRDSVNAMRAKTNALLGAFDAETQYRQALKDATAQSKKNEAGIEGNTKAALANRDSLGQLAGAWNNQSNAVKNNVARFRESRAAFIQTAVAMGVPTAAAEKLADRLLEIPKSVVSKVSLAGAPEAIALAARVKASIDNIRDRTVYLTTVTRSIGGRPTGGQAPGSAYASGGYTGDGGKYEPAGIVHRGEVVIPADRVRTDWSSLKARYGDLPGMATGGMAGFTASTGIGPNSQLFGINEAFLSIRELGDRLAALSRGQLRDMARDIDDVNGKGLKKLTASLEKATAISEKQYDAAKERLDEEMGVLKDLRQARKSLAEDVASNFRTDVFGGNLDVTTAPGFSQGLNAYIAAHPELQLGNVSGDDRRAAYLDSLTPAQISALQAQASVGQLQNDARNAEAFEAILQQLRAMGLSGGAFTELATSGNLAQAQSYAAMGPDFIATLEASYAERNADLKNLGQYVGNVRFGADIREQLQETRRLNRAAEQQLGELREIRQSGRRVESRLAALEKRAQTNPQETGAAVGRAVSGVAAAAQRSVK